MIYLVKSSFSKVWERNLGRLKRSCRCRLNFSPGTLTLSVFGHNVSISESGLHTASVSTHWSFHAQQRFSARKIAALPNQETSDISVGSDSPLRNLVSSDSAFHKGSSKLKALVSKHLSSYPFSSPFPPISHLFQVFLVTLIF